MFPYRSSRRFIASMSPGIIEVSAWNSFPRMRRRRVLWLLALGLVLVSAHSAWALTNGLALTPPMGWNSWNKFGCNINETLIRQIADAMATNGMKDAGYQYVNLDDCWQVNRDMNGVILADPARFPGGISNLAAYVHSRGLKLGVYSDRGTSTCAGRPGSYGHEVQDANTYAAWGVDYLKYDNCNPAAGSDQATDYNNMKNALLNCGRPIVFSICAWTYKSWMPDCGNLWRTTADISDSFSSMVANLDQNNASAAVAGPGRWNDPDMLEVGNGSMTDTEYRAHFSLWCIVSAPLLAGNDLRSMSAATTAILTAPEVIAVDQDPAGAQGLRVASTAGAGGNLEVWSKPLGADFTTKAVALFNRSTNAATIAVNWSDIGLSGLAAVRDLWARTDLGTFTNSFATNVPAHGAVLVKIVGVPPLPSLGTNYLSDLQWLGAANGWGPVERDRSNGEQAAGDGHTITLNGVTYPKGLGVHAPSQVDFFLGGIVARFISDAGVDDEVGAGGSVVFQVWADGVKLNDTGLMTGASSTQTINLDTSGRNVLSLIVTDGGDNKNSDHADWAGARVVVTAASAAPRFVALALAGNKLMVQGVSGWTNASYRVLTSTNVALPAGQWTPVATNQFDAAGRFRFTNTLDPAAPQQFLRLQSP